MADAFPQAAEIPVREGLGHITGSIGADAVTRFDARIGFNGDVTTSEDLLSAALAARYVAALTGLCRSHKLSVKKIDADAQVTLGRDAMGYFVQAIHVDLSGRISGIDEPGFHKLAEVVCSRCPIASALGVSDVTFHTRLD